MAYIHITEGNEMGLDMYLTGKRFLWSAEPDSALSKEIARLLGDVPKRVKGLDIEVAYWRKSNEIHRWFVDNVQGGNDDCEEYDVSREQLAELRQRCVEVMADHDKAAELLPTQPGFFFGGTDYDKWYFESLEDTVKQINEALALPDCWDFTYRASW